MPGTEPSSQHVEAHAATSHKHALPSFAPALHASLAKQNTWFLLLQPCGKASGAVYVAIKAPPVAGQRPQSRDESPVERLHANANSTA